MPDAHRSPPKASRSRPAAPSSGPALLVPAAAPFPTSSFAPLHRRRTRRENLNHHLWNNHGTWFVHYTVYPTPITKERVRRSLGTTNLLDARSRRDRFFIQLAALDAPPAVKRVAA